MDGKDFKSKIIAFVILVFLSGAEGLDAFDVFKKENNESASLYSLQKTVDKIYNLQMQYCFKNIIDSDKAKG